MPMCPEQRVTYLLHIILDNRYGKGKNRAGECRLLICLPPGTGPENKPQIQVNPGAFGSKLLAGTNDATRANSI